MELSVCVVTCLRRSLDGMLPRCSDLRYADISCFDR